MSARKVYGVLVEHDVFRLPSFGPFLSAAEAGAAIDRLTERFPTAAMTMLMPHEIRHRGKSEAEHAKEYDDGQWRLELVLGEQHPFSVIELLDGGPWDSEPSVDAIEAIAREHGAKPSELGVIDADRQGVQAWVVCRVHMETNDPKKAETATRWRRNEMAGDQQSVVAVKLPIKMPALHAAK